MRGLQFFYPMFCCCSTVGLGSILLSPNPVIIGMFETPPEFKVEDTLTRKMVKEWKESQPVSATYLRSIST